MQSNMWWTRESTFIALPYRDDRKSYDSVQLHLLFNRCYCISAVVDPARPRYPGACFRGVSLYETTFMLGTNLVVR